MIRNRFVQILQNFHFADDTQDDKTDRAFKIITLIDHFNRKKFCRTIMNKALTSICDVLRDLVPFVQFKKREKHPWRNDTFSKVAGF